MDVRNDAETEWKANLGRGFVRHRPNLASLTVGDMNRAARWEACDSNEIPFTAASDLSVSPNGGIERDGGEGGHALPRLDCEIVTIRETERQIADSLPLTPSTNAERTATSA